MIVLVAGVLAQGFDAATMQFSHEANPLVLVLGPSAYLLKAALIVVVPVLVISLPKLPPQRDWTHRFQVPMARCMSWLLLAVGLLGAASNLRARGLF